MYIKRIQIENVRGFRSLDFTLSRSTNNPAGWTVITGDNGSGKTAFLKALALALVGPDVARALQPSLKGWVRDGADLGEIAIEIVPHPEDKFLSPGPRYKSSFWAELELVRTGSEVTLRPGKKRRKQKKGPLGGPWKEGSEGWFAAGYGPFRRLYGHSPEAQRLMSGPSRVARFATMFKEDATLGECEQWLRELNHKALEQKDREKAILAQLVRLLNHDFLQNGMKVKGVDSDGLWLEDRSGTVLPLMDMSDGYRAALAMMVDIVRHIVTVFGHEDLITDRDGTLFLNQQGIVLIDEVDAHLHPEWQRQIGFWLKKHFPRVQFIVTTHSALICQAADQDGIFHLPAPSSECAPFQLTGDEYFKIVRSKPDTILLSSAFGLAHTRSPLAVANRERYAQLAAKARVASLSPKERTEKRQLEMFVEPAEDLSANDGSAGAAAH